MFEEPTLVKGGLAIDDRGVLRFMNEFTFPVKRFYQVSNHHSHFIRAWHGHKNEAKAIWVNRGVAIVKLFPMICDPKQDNPVDWVTSWTLSDVGPSLLIVPPGYFNGFKTLTDDTVITFFSSSTLEESKGDDIRLSWDIWGPDLWAEDYR
jgi:dTDP-4-dehydrorhamnose 3,5-epimerase-like enzyme